MKIKTRELTLCAVLSAPRTRACPTWSRFFRLRSLCRCRASSSALPISLRSTRSMPSAFQVRSPYCSCAARLARCSAGNASALLFSLLGGLAALGDGAFAQGEVTQHLWRFHRRCGGTQHRAGLRRDADARLERAALLPAVSAAGVAFTGAFSGLITACLFRAMAHTPYGTKGENHHG